MAASRTAEPVAQPRCSRGATTAPTTIIMSHLQQEQQADNQETSQQHVQPPRQGSTELHLQCCACKLRPRNVGLLPCMHLALCGLCWDAMKSMTNQVRAGGEAQVQQLHRQLHILGS